VRKALSSWEARHQVEEVLGDDPRLVARRFDEHAKRIGRRVDQLGQIGSHGLS
jgi:hypothetical protein